MKYTKKEIGIELNEELNKGYSCEKISNWAYNLLYIKIREKPSPEISSILNDLSAMDAGPEFEYTEQELKLLSELLIKEAKDPIKEINDRKLKNERDST